MSTNSQSETPGPGHWLSPDFFVDEWPPLPLQQLAPLAGAAVLLNLTAGVGPDGKEAYRRELLAAHPQPLYAYPSTGPSSESQVQAE